jgi:signal transduction histidine kinase
MFLFAVPLLSVHEIELEWKIEDALKEERILMDKRKNLYLIFKESVNNTVKYAACSRMTVSISKKEDMLEMILMDNGIGFDLQRHSDGNGLPNMEQRAKEMDGILIIYSIPGGGTTVTLRFPVSSQSYA